MTKEWHENRGIWVIDWPPCSPDLNNIEYIWRALKNELYQLHSNLHELKNNEAGVEIFQSRVKEAWKYIDQAHIQKLVACIHGRLDACQDDQG